MTTDTIDVYAAIESLGKTALRIADERNYLLAACKAALPNMEWANIHGSRCEEELAQLKEAIAKAEGRA